MEKFVRGIRETYFRSLIEDYQNEEKNSFLYRSFWAEKARELIKESLPPLPNRKELGKQIKELYKGFLGPLTDKENGPEKMEEHFARLSEEAKEHFARLSEEAKELLRVHLPQLPEGIATLLKEHFRQLPGEVKELLTGRFPWLQEEETSWLGYRSQIGDLLKKNMRERPEWARKVLLQKPPRKAKEEQEAGQEQKKERRDFWKELMLNDAGYRAGLITDTEYYVWLTEYLAVRKKYWKNNYRDISMYDGYTWLYELLAAGLGRKSEEPVRFEKVQKGGENLGDKAGKNRRDKASQKRREKAGVERDLEELAEKLRYEAETGGGEISGRLHGLKRKEDGKDYLLWLTGKLQRMAVHGEIRNWLQDSGYPLRDEGETEKQDEAKRLLQESRKQDSSMRRFAAYCDSEKGFDFIEKKAGGREADKGWVVRNGFCVWRPDDAEEYLQALVQVLKKKKKDDFYIPLAVDLYSGCVFFLAGKRYYEKYREEACKKGGDEEAFFCYDYLRLDEEEDAKYSAVAFRLQDTFDENVGKEYKDVLNEFKWYCGKGAVNKVETWYTGDGQDTSYEAGYNPRRKIKSYINEELPDKAPKEFLWIFEKPEEWEPSPEARESFNRVQKKYAKSDMKNDFVKITNTYETTCYTVPCKAAALKKT